MCHRNFSPQMSSACLQICLPGELKKLSSLREYPTCEMCGHLVFVVSSALNYLPISVVKMKVFLLSPNRTTL